jgi:heavy-metal-associated domain-containing protein
MSMASTRDRVTVLHSIPGRLRLRLPDRSDSASLIDALGATPGIVSSSWSSRTRTLLVRYAPDTITANAISETVGRHTRAAVDDRQIAISKPADVTLGAAVTQAVGDLDQRVRQTSRGIVSLGSLVPLGLVVWAAAELLRGRAAPLAWSSALWYAHGLFRDYNLPRSD